MGVFVRSALFQALVIFAVFGLSGGVSFLKSRNVLISAAADNFSQSTAALNPALPQFSEKKSVLEEGFSVADNELPPALLNAWNSSLMFFHADGNSYNIGSSFIIEKKAISPTETTIFLLTNYHVVEKACAGLNSICPNLYALNNIGFNTESVLFFRSGEGFFRINGVYLVKFSKNPDLAILALTVPAELAQNLGVMDMAKSRDPAVGEAVFNIGYPMLLKRTSSTKKELERPHLIVKRWSSGVVEKVFSTKEYGNLLAHSADSLPGSSGSVLASSDGSVVGINFQIFDARSDFDYAGGGCGTPGATRAAITASEIRKFIGIIH